nr:hypothetical protein BaRGS_002225 [Batillaria attramentaria]
MAAAARQPRSLYLASPGSDYCVKVILLGDVGVGKTTILNTYTQGRPRVAHRASVSLSPSSRDRIVLYHDKKVKVSLWDTAVRRADVITYLDWFFIIASLPVRRADAIIYFV